MSYELRCPHCGENLGSGHNQPVGGGEAHVQFSLRAVVPKEQVQYLSVPQPRPQLQEQS